MAARFLGTVESFAVLVAIGAAPSLAVALIIESLGQGIRAAGSPVPGMLGVQEAGDILLVGLFGMTPETGLALSLTKRLPDPLIGMGDRSPGWVWSPAVSAQAMPDGPQSQKIRTAMARP